MEQPGSVGKTVSSAVSTLLVPVTPRMVRRQHPLRTKPPFTWNGGYGY